MREEDIDALALEIAATRRNQDIRDQVLSEFADMAVAQQYIDQGGIEYAK